MLDEAKTCRGCKRRLAAAKFHRCSRYQDGRQLLCIECRRHERGAAARISKPLVMRSCPECGAEFGTRKGKVYCAERCYLTAVRRTSAERNARAETAREAARQRREQNLTPRRCAGCALTMQRGPKEKPSHYARRTYCTLACAYQHRINVGNRSRSIRARPCPVCGRSFTPISERARRTCSKACGYLYRKTTTTRAEIRTCEGCHEEYRRVPANIRTGQGRRFCSARCARRVIGQCVKMIRCTCAQCGREFRRNGVALARTQSDAKCCSPRCSGLSRRGPLNPLWRGGTHGYRGAGWKRIANRIRQACNDRCVQCGVSGSSLSAVLHVDHIWPYRLFETSEAANDPRNLIALCPSCHAKKTHSAEADVLRGSICELAEFIRSIRDRWHGLGDGPLWNIAEAHPDWWGEQERAQA